MLVRYQENFGAPEGVNIFLENKQVGDKRPAPFLAPFLAPFPGLFSYFISRYSTSVQGLAALG